MNITPAARQLLQRLCDSDKHAIGILFEGAVGSCRASVPLFKLVRKAPENLPPVKEGPFTFFIATEYRDIFQRATLDYERGLFSKGLNLTWPHREGGCPNCSDSCT